MLVQGLSNLRKLLNIKEDEIGKNSIKSENDHNLIVKLADSI